MKQPITDLSASSSAEALTFHRVSHRYADGTKALQDLHFTVYSGEHVALVGNNGAGKSTLLLHTNGLLRPTEGRIFIRGEELTPQSEERLRPQIGMVFQDSEDQLFLPTVEEDIAFGPRNQGLSEEEVEDRVARALQTVGITHLRKRPSFQLSGGEKRRAAIATILSMNPSMWVLDEPSNGLDGRARRQLIQWLKSLPCTLLMATHDLEMAWELCERTLILKEGRLWADGATRELLGNRELLLQCDIEPPSPHSQLPT